MKNDTQNLLDKYKTIIAGLIDCKPKDIKVLVETVIDEGLPTRKLQYVEVGELYYRKPGDSDYADYTTAMNWSQGRYLVKCKGAFMASFKLYEMPHCCAIMISCNAEVATAYQHKHVGTTLNMLRQDIGRILGYSLMLCTDVAQNTYQRKILATNGWKDIYDVVNRRTTNRVYISVINL